jgi:hypothetical protein
MRGENLQTNILDIAKKQRHLSLLQKIRHGKTLTAREIEEIAEYEKKQEVVKEKPAKAMVGRPAAAVVKGWALKYETMADAEAGENLGFEIKSVLKTKSLKAAWQRGQFLRKLSAAGKGNASLEEVEHDLQLAEGTLGPLLEKDDEAREQFNNARFSTIMKVRAAIVEMVENKKLTPTTLKQLETFLRMQVVRKDVDFDKVPTDVMAELFGVTRQTLIDWKKNRGMPFNADGSYNLRGCLQQTWREKEDGTRERVPCWFEKMLADKIISQPGKFGPAAVDDAEALRRAKLKMQIAEMEKRLIGADVSMGSILARAAAIDKYMTSAVEGLHLKLSGGDPARVKAELESFVAGLREASLRLPANYYESLPDWAAADFRELMEKLKESEPRRHEGTNNIN